MLAMIDDMKFPWCMPAQSLLIGPHLEETPGFANPNRAPATTFYFTHTRPVRFLTEHIRHTEDSGHRSGKSAGLNFWTISSAKSPVVQATKPRH